MVGGMDYEEAKEMFHRRWQFEAKNGYDTTALRLIRFLLSECERLHMRQTELRPAPSGRWVDCECGDVAQCTSRRTVTHGRCRIWVKS